MRLSNTLKGSVYLAILLFVSCLSVSATAGDVLSLITEGPNHASDDNREYLIDRNLGQTGDWDNDANTPNTVAAPGQIDVGDSLRAHLDINTVNSTSANVGGISGNDEWSGVAQIKVTDKVRIFVGPDGLDNTDDDSYLLTFAPDPAFEADLGGGQTAAPVGFSPGAGAMVVMFEDATNDAAFDFDDPAPALPPAGPDDGAAPQTVPPSSADVSVGPYAVEEAFIATAANGNHFWTLGFAGPDGLPMSGDEASPGPGEGWVSQAGDRVLPFFNVSTGVLGGNFNGGLSRLFNGNAGLGDGVNVTPITSGTFGLVEFAASGGVRGVNDLDTPFEISSNFDIAFNVSPIEELLGCRLTGGGVTEDYTDDGELFMAYTGRKPHAEGEAILTSGGVNRYQMHGQVGARTALSPQPWGEWSHSQQSGPAGKFVFHAGTRSAPAGTEIVEIRCSDPGTCFPSGNPPSPLKQLDFDCIGTFKSIASGRNAPTWLIGGANVTDEGNGNQTFDGTFHWCEVNVDDLGEGPNGDTYPDACPAEGFGEKSDPPNIESANCDCPDFYRISIYNGVDASTPSLFLPDGNIDQTKLDKTNVIYEVDAYLQHGNGLQIHDLTGFDR